MGQETSEKPRECSLAVGADIRFLQGKPLKIPEVPKTFKEKHHCEVLTRITFSCSMPCVPNILVNF